MHHDEQRRDHGYRVFAPKNHNTLAGARTLTFMCLRRRHFSKASHTRRAACQTCLGIGSITMTLDTYGQLFPRGDDRAELAKASRLLLA
jgi:hypothetical protein